MQNATPPIQTSRLIFRNPREAEIWSQARIAGSAEDRADQIIKDFRERVPSTAAASGPLHNWIWGTGTNG